MATNHQKRVRFVPGILWLWQKGYAAACDAALCGFKSRQSPLLQKWSFVQWQGSCLIRSLRGFDSRSSDQAFQAWAGIRVRIPQPASKVLEIAGFVRVV